MDSDNRLGRFLSARRALVTPEESGLQLVTTWYAEDLLLRLAALLESVSPSNKPNGPLPLARPLRAVND
jgi:hypothetical protein